MVKRPSLCELEFNQLCLTVLLSAMMTPLPLTMPFHHHNSDQTETLPIFQIPYDGEFVPPGVGMGVNNLLFNPHTMHGEIKAGTCEEWTVGTLALAL